MNTFWELSLCGRGDAAGSARRAAGTHHATLAEKATKEQKMERALGCWRTYQQVLYYCTIFRELVLLCVVGTENSQMVIYADLDLRAAQLNDQLMRQTVTTAILGTIQQEQTHSSKNNCFVTSAEGIKQNICRNCHNYLIRVWKFTREIFLKWKNCSKLFRDLLVITKFKRMNFK